MPLNNQPPNSIAKKGSKDVVSVTGVERRQDVTVLACMNAAGHFISPFVLFKGVRKRHDFLIGMPSDTEVAITEKGWQTTAWQHSYTKKRITKVAFGGLFKQAWNQAATVGNATKGFEKTRIFPLNANAISDHKFIRDTPESKNEQQLDGTLSSVDAEQVDDAQPSTTHQRVEDTQSPTCSKQLANERSDSIDVRNAMKEIVSSALKGPTVTKKPRELTKLILHLTSPQSKKNLLMKEINKKGKEEKNSKVKEKRSLLRIKPHLE
ncbi:hypothetical protein ILUMI_14755 [Ignelater luminosus]|uniref:DDE-1 domain-containing protein n=1 Tax=Ignelater luminosus TaxID=2038154 RepID=A0A8K0GAM1_IGNLU|nr:hypothetical protein ILUMI_14755 [Ignelater luminosus]